jgi:hypothetical protein
MSELCSAFGMLWAAFRGDKSSVVRMQLPFQSVQRVLDQKNSSNQRFINRLAPENESKNSLLLLILKCEVLDRSYDSTDWTDVEEDLCKQES